ncbi:MAG: thiamine phosphate synthase [Alphaproteobacteria bacterium]|nr:thiamine phosphate synthase [Alphaproteobacteria bacterium]
MPGSSTQRQPNDATSQAPRLYLTTPAVGGPAEFAPALAEAVKAAEVAAVLLRLADADERTLINRIKVLAPVVQNAGAALVLDGRPELAARAGADGAHLNGIAAFTDAVDGLKPARIAGCGGLPTRHDAMLAGERGADYAMFGEPDASGRRPSFEAIVERVAWWANLFEVPCVAYAANQDEIAALAEAGADFVAVGDWIWSDPRGPAAAVAAAAAALKTPEPAA